jgi:hypothetical protein
MKKGKFVLVLCAAMCAVMSFSCTKTSKKPIEEVIIGKWEYNQYHADTESLRVLLADALNYNQGFNKDSVDFVYEDFSRITEFTVDGWVLLYADESEIESTSEGDGEGAGAGEGEGAGAGEGEGAGDGGASIYQKGTYVISSDTLYITYDGNDGFPLSKAKVWVNNDNWISMSTKIADYVNVEAIIAKLAMDPKRANELRTGYIEIYFKRHVSKQ